jgi:hypothetical protein
MKSKTTIIEEILANLVAQSEPNQKTIELYKNVLERERRAECLEHSKVILDSYPNYWTLPDLERKEIIIRVTLASLVKEVPLNLPKLRCFLAAWIETLNTLVDQQIAAKFSDFDTWPIEEQEGTRRAMYQTLQECSQ